MRPARGEAVIVADPFTRVARYGDTFWNRLADRLEWIVDDLVMPLFFILLGLCFAVVLLAIIVGVTIEVVT